MPIGGLARPGKLETTVEFTHPSPFFSVGFLVFHSAGDFGSEI